MQTTVLETKDQATPYPTEAPTAGDEEAIRELVHRINAAWTEDRLEELEDLFHPELVTLHPEHGNQLEGAEAAIDSFRQFNAVGRLLSFSPKEPQVKLWGPTAVATYDFEVAYAMGERRFDESGTDIFAFSREDGRWRAVWRMTLTTCSLP